MAVESLVSVILGAVLALAGGISTELWKQRKAARAAARLVWQELILARSALLGAVALGQWPDGDFPFADDAWRAQRDQLALGWDTTDFHDVQTAYLQLRAIATGLPRRSARQRGWRRGSSSSSGGRSPNVWK